MPMVVSITKILKGASEKHLVKYLRPTLAIFRACREAIAAITISISTFDHQSASMMTMTMMILTSTRTISMYNKVELW